MIEIAIAEALGKYTVDLQTGCWNWDGTLNEDGYGQISVPSTRCDSGVTTIRAHRLFYVNHVGPLILGDVLDHKCRNARCVNPEHLEPVSNAENVRRGLSAKLTAKQVSEIRNRYRAGGVSHLALACEFSVSERNIQQIVTGQSWTVGIDNPVLTCGKPGRPCALSLEERNSLLGRYAAGETQSKLARAYGVSAALVCLLIKEEKRKTI